MSWIATAEKALTTEQARALTLAIRDKLTDLLPMIKQAYEGRADQALGYATWHDYCMAELSGLRIPLTDRPAAVAELRQSGMSTRAIGSALGVNHSTVVRDLASGGADAPPERINGADGKTYAPTQPRVEPDPVEPKTDSAAICEACGGPMDAGQYEAGFMRCDACDGDEAHTAVGWPHGRDGGSATCAEQAGPVSQLPKGQEHADAALVAIDQAVKQTAERPWSPEETELRQQLEAGETIVVSLRAHHADLVAWAETQGLLVRIDRRTEWGNPFEMPGDGDRKTVIESYADHYLPYKPSLLSKVEGLRGKALGCWCAPEPCHGDILKLYAEEADQC